MAHVTLLALPVTAFVGDNDAQLVAGDAPARLGSFLGRPVLKFGDTDEEAAVSAELPMPGQYGGGTLKATLLIAMASDASNDVAFDLFVEAKTPGADTLDLTSASAWDAANATTISLGGTTAGDPVPATVTLTNKDSVAAGDSVRFGIRRDCDSGNDDAVGDAYVAWIEIWEDTA